MKRVNYKTAIKMLSVVSGVSGVFFMARRTLNKDETHKRKGGKCKQIVGHEDSEKQFMMKRDTINRDFLLKAIIELGEIDKDLIEKAMMKMVSIIEVMIVRAIEGMDFREKVIIVLGSIIKDMEGMDIMRSEWIEQSVIESFIPKH